MINLKIKNNIFSIKRMQAKKYYKLANNTNREEVTKFVDSLYDSKKIKQRGFSKDSFFYSQLISKPFTIPYFKAMLNNKNLSYSAYEIEMFLSGFNKQNAKYFDTFMDYFKNNKNNKDSLPMLNVGIFMFKLGHMDKNILKNVLKSNDATLIQKTIQHEEVKTASKLIKSSKYLDLMDKYKENTFFYPEKLWIISDIERKMAATKDRRIKAMVDKMLFSDFNTSHNFFKSEVINTANDLLDVYHNFKGNYGIIGANSDEYYKKMIQETPSLKEKFLQSAKKNHSPNVKQDKIHTQAKLFAKNKKFDALKYFLKMHRGDKKLCDFVYNEYYLSTLSKEAREICKGINEKFATKVFAQKENLNSLRYVQNELLEWEKAGKDNVKFPKQIDLSSIYPEYVNSKTVGLINHTTDIITTKGDNLDDVVFSLRHEMTHLNELNTHKQDEFQHILSEKKFKNELVNAGLNHHGQAEYAYTNKSEFIAVASCGDVGKYSDEFKQVLIEAGLPEWVFKLKNTRLILKENKLN